MGVTFKFWLLCLKMRPGISFFVLLSLIGLSQSIFFSTRSTCSSNRQCPNIRRQSSNCNGSFNLLGLKIPTCRNEYNNIGGRCVTNTNVFCAIGGALGGRRRNCDYRKCAECIISRDCPNCYECRGNTCSYACNNSVTPPPGR